MDIHYVTLNVCSGGFIVTPHLLSFVSSSPFRLPGSAHECPLDSPMGSRPAVIQNARFLNFPPNRLLIHVCKFVQIQSLYFVSHHGTYNCPNTWEFHQPNRHTNVPIHKLYPSLPVLICLLKLGVNYSSYHVTFAIPLVSSTRIVCPFTNCCRLQVTAQRWMWKKILDLYLLQKNRFPAPPNTTLSNQSVPTELNTLTTLPYPEPLLSSRMLKISHQRQ